MKLEDHFNDTALEFFERQSNFADLAGELAWQLRAEDSELSFGTRQLGLLFRKKMTYSVALLGTESLRTNTFRWPWASDYADKPFGRLGNKLRALDIDEFESDELQVNGFGNPEAMDLASMAAASLGLAMYRCPHRRGAVYVGLVDALEFSPAQSASQVAAVIGEAVQSLVILDQMRAVRAYCSARDWSVRETANRIDIEAPDGVVEVVFGDGGWLQKARVRP